MSKAADRQEKLDEICMRASAQNLRDDKAQRHWPRRFGVDPDESGGTQGVRVERFAPLFCLGLCWRLAAPLILSSSYAQGGHNKATTTNNGAQRRMRQSIALEAYIVKISTSPPLPAKGVFVRARWDPNRTPSWALLPPYLDRDGAAKAGFPQVKAPYSG
jgi:hypothetical protein